MAYQFDDLQLLQAVSDWQRGGDAKQNLRRGLALKAACAPLPEQYRTSPLASFRQVGLEQGSVWDLIGEDSLAEKVSSWAFDIEIATAFKSGVPPNGQGYQGVIFCINPPPSSHVIVNLRELYKSPAFCAAMERNKSAITSFSDGVGRYWDSQSEIVLEIDAVTQEDIYSLDGHSSPFEQLVAPRSGTHLCTRSYATRGRGTATEGRARPGASRPAVVNPRGHKASSS